jgi:glycosyltransferase involved in cell wall biosynthesis
VPVWLFSQTPPAAATSVLCERVYVNPSSLGLLFEAQRRLWPYWVALGVATWTGERGRWAIKLTPFLIPPFRVLVLNRNGDFFGGTPVEIFRHAARRTRDALHSGWHRVGDASRFIWSLVSYHIWRSSPVRRLEDEAAGASLWLASLLLRLVSALHGPSIHRIFRAVRGSRRLQPAVLPSNGGGVVRFYQKGTHWSPTTLDVMLRHTTARWLLWLEDGRAPTDIEDMLPLFADERTFAVTRQSHFRAWKPQLIPTAPFRALQPGEASQVLAPLSNAILVDRNKLLSLGIPHCGLAGTAWMILFWKAAAAGWRSFSAGQDAALREQPDLPMQETGFLVNLLRHRELRGLGPVEPDLSRGSIAIAVAAAAAAPPKDKPRVLLVSPFLPYPLSHGGAVRIWNLCRALCGRVEFILAANREELDTVDYRKLREVFREVYVVDRDERPSPDERLPGQVRQYVSSGMRALIVELAEKWQPDLLQIEYTHMAAYRDAAPAIPAILVEHDLTFSLYRQLAEKKDAAAGARAEYERWLDFERHWLREFDMVWTMSEEDRAIAVAESGRPADRTLPVPNGVDIERFVARDEPVSAPEIFYVGSFRHLPNIIGFEKLRQEVMPRVWSRFREARLRVVAGPRHEDFWNHFTPSRRSPAFDPRVEIHGFVEDLRPLYARASVVVVPLEVSAGTNIKVLEAMACARSVVTTPVGCAGLGLRDRHDAFIEAGWEGFAESVNLLLSDPALRSRVAAEARRTAESRFSWTAIAAGAMESYGSLLSAPPRIGLT